MAAFFSTGLGIGREDCKDEAMLLNLYQSYRRLTSEPYELRIDSAVTDMNGFTKGYDCRSLSIRKAPFGPIPTKRLTNSNTCYTFAAPQTAQTGYTFCSSQKFQLAKSLEREAQAVVVVRVRR